MTENTSMKLQTINVILHVNKDNDQLAFQFPETTIIVDLNSDSSQQQLLSVFEHIFKLLVSLDVKLELKIDDDYRKQLYIEVCKEFISELNREIKAAEQMVHKDFPYEMLEL